MKSLAFSDQCRGQSCVHLDSSFVFPDTECSVSQGWLTRETEVRFRFHDNPVNIYDYRLDSPVFISCVPTAASRLSGHQVTVHCTCCRVVWSQTMVEFLIYTICMLSFLAYLQLPWVSCCPTVTNHWPKFPFGENTY